MLTTNHKVQKNVNQSTKWPIFMACLSSVILLNSASAQTFYKWVDKAGSTHYTQTPPPGNQAKKAKTIQVDDAPVPQNYASTSNANTVENNNSNTASGLNANQLAQAANAGSVPNAQPAAQQNSPQPSSSVNSVPNNQPRANNVPAPVIQPLNTPPANRLITPSQDQVRPAFSDR